MKTYNLKERQEHIKRVKCALFNKTSDDCNNIRYEHKGDTHYKKCGITGNACLYKLCPKIAKKAEEKKHGKKK